jgi:vacuolar-type H+-ATPase subunit I/STV1
MTTTFDTLKFARRLRDNAGFTAEHAEATAEALADVMAGDLATKADLNEVRQSLKADIREASQELRTELRETAQELRTELRKTAQELRTELRETAQALQAEIRETAQAAKSDLKDAVQALTLRIEHNAAEMLVMKWMLGFVLAFLVAISLKLFLH